jgi:hypothetical protein
VSDDGGAAALAREYHDAVLMTESRAFRDGSAEEKQHLLWDAVRRNPYSTLPPITFSVLETLGRMLDRNNLRKAFDVEADVRPPRVKLFHPFGAVARVRFEPEPQTRHPFSGLFKSGGPGLARLSLALDTEHYSPSAAFKLFIDGRHPSQNILLDQSLDRQSSGDFFERAPTNITLWPKLPPMSRLWWLIQWWLSALAPPLHQYLDSVASVTCDGVPVQSPIVPYRLLFYAPPETHGDPAFRGDFREELARVPEGTVLYRLYGTRSEECDEKFPIATIRTESRFVASGFGDHVLSLRHTAGPGEAPE